MMKIEFGTGNAAFTDEVDGSMDDYYEKRECMRILGTIINKLNDGYTYGSCIDINGNKVGEWSLD